MEKYSLLPLLLLLIACGEETKQTSQPTIAVSCENAQFTEVFLIAQGEDQFDTIAKAELIDGKVEIPYSLDYPEMVYLAFNDYGRPLQIFADLDGMEVNVNFATNPPEKVIAGSLYNDQAEVYYSIEDEFNQAMRSYQPLRVQAQADPIVAEILKAKEDSTYAHFKQAALDFCYDNGIVGVFIANRRVFDLTYAQADSVYQNVPANMSGSKEVKALKEKRDILKKVEIGQPTIDIQQTSVLGDVVSLDETVKQNKYTLLYFWASWHQLSRASNKDLALIHKKFHSKGFEIYGVSLDEDKAQWIAAVSEDALEWPNVSDLGGVENEAAKKYGIYYLPQSVLINSNGIIEVKNMAKDDLELYLEEKLN